MAQTPGIGASYPSRKRKGEMPEWEQENDEMSKPSGNVERSDGDSKQYSSENSENEKPTRKSKTALTEVTNGNGSSEPTLKSEIRRFFKVPPYYLTVRSSEVHKLCTFVRAPVNSILEEMPKAKKAKKAKKVKKVLEAPPVEVLIRTQCPHGPSCRHDDPVEEFKMVCEEQKSAVMAAMRAEAEKQARMSRREKAKAKQEPKVIEFTAYCHRSSPTQEMKAKEDDQASELPTPQAPQGLQTSSCSTHFTENPLEAHQSSQQPQLPPDIPRSPVKQVKVYQESEEPQTPLNTPHMAGRKTKVAKTSQMLQTSSESAQAAEIVAKVDQASYGLQTPSNIPRSTGKKTKNDQASTLPPTPSSTPSCIKKRMKVTTSTDAPQSAELAVEADQGSDARPTSPDSPQTAVIKMKVNLLTEAYQKLGKSPRSAGPRSDIEDDQSSDSQETPPRSPCSGGEDITVDQVSELLQELPDSPQTAEMKAKIELLTRAYQELGISDEESEADTLPPPPKTYENSLLSAKGRGDHSPEAPKDLSSSEEIHETPEDLQSLFDDPELLESIKRFLFYANSSDNDDSASRRRQKPDIYDVKTETDEHIFAMSTNSRLTYIETYQCRAVLVCLREFEMLIKSRSDDHQRIRNVTLKSAKALKNLINTVYNICQSENLLMEVMKRSLEMAFESYCKPSSSS